MGIRTIGDLAKSDETLLVRKLGKMGSILWAFANGYDESPVKLENTSAPVKSVGNSTTTPRDMETDEDVKIVLIHSGRKCSGKTPGEWFPVPDC